MRVRVRVRVRVSVRVSLAAPMAVGRLVALPPVSACSAAPICPPPPIASYDPCSLAYAFSTTIGQISRRLALAAYLVRVRVRVRVSL